MFKGFQSVFNCKALTTRWKHRDGQGLCNLLSIEFEADYQTYGWIVM